MARTASNYPTDGELEILRVLWQIGPASLSAVCQQLREQRAVATTTVATMLRVMRNKRLVKRQGTGRSARWLASVSHDAAARNMVGKLVDHLFDGAADRLATHLIEGGRLTDSQLGELRKLIDVRRRDQRDQNQKGTAS